MTLHVESQPCYRVLCSSMLQHDAACLTAALLSRAVLA